MTSNAFFVASFIEGFSIKGTPTVINVFEAAFLIAGKSFPGPVNNKSIPASSAAAASCAVVTLTCVIFFLPLRFIKSLTV